MKLFLLFTIFYTILSCTQQQHDNYETSEENQYSQILTPDSEVNKGEATNIKGCGYDSEIIKKQVNVYLPRQREVDEVKKIIAFSGLPLNFEIYSADIQNAVATIIGQKRYILYDPKLLNFTDESSKTYWSSMSILAHEIGHHLSGHTLNNTVDNHSAELEADKFSGFTLYKMGATLDQATDAMRLIGSETDSKTHPSKYRRLKAIEEGWKEAAILRYEGAVPPPPEDIPESRGSTEFTKEMLWSEQALSTDRNTYDYNNEFYEGIITEIEAVEGYSKDEYFSLQVHVVKEGETIIQKPYKMKIYVDNLQDGRDMCHFCLSLFLEIIEPGRKIKFAYIMEGSGGVCTLSYLDVVQ